MKAEPNAERGHAHVKTIEYVERGLHLTANVPNGDTEVGGGAFVGVPHALRSEPRRGNSEASDVKALPHRRL